MVLLNYQQTMKKIYRSAIDRMLLVPATAFFIASFIYFLAEGSYIVSFGILVFVSFLVYLYRCTFYELTRDNKLKVHSGFLFHREIYIHSIRRVKSARDHSPSPALSRNRLQIFYNRYGSVLISPQHRQEFIEELKKINPRISFG